MSKMIGFLCFLTVLVLEASAAPSPVNKDLEVKAAMDTKQNFGSDPTHNIVIQLYLNGEEDGISGTKVKRSSDYVKKIVEDNQNSEEDLALSETHIFRPLFVYRAAIAQKKKASFSDDQYFN